MSPQIRPVKKELQLNYSIEKVKQSIDIICKKGRFTYKLKDKNDVFNTYRIDVQNGLKSSTLSIVLSKVDSNNTIASFETYAPFSGASVPLVSPSFKRPLLQSSLQPTFSRKRRACACFNKAVCLSYQQLPSPAEIVIKATSHITKTNSSPQNLPLTL